MCCSTSGTAHSINHPSMVQNNTNNILLNRNLLLGIELQHQHWVKDPVNVCTGAQQYTMQWTLGAWVVYTYKSLRSQSISRCCYLMKVTGRYVTRSLVFPRCDIDQGIERCSSYNEANCVIKYRDPVWQLVLLSTFEHNSNTLNDKPDGLSEIKIAYSSGSIGLSLNFLNVQWSSECIQYVEKGWLLLSFTWQ